MHVHYHCLLPLKGNMNVWFGARQHVLNGYLKQNYGECNAHFFASYTVCLARCECVCAASTWRVQVTLIHFFLGSIHLFFNQSLIISPTHTHVCKNAPYEPWSQVFPTWPNMMRALCNRPYLKYLRISSHTAPILFCTVACFLGTEVL